MTKSSKEKVVKRKEKECTFLLPNIIIKTSIIEQRQ